MSKLNNWTVSFANNTVEGGKDTQAEYFRAIGATVPPGKWYTTHQGVWISAGASYGPQVEFESESALEAFIKANPGAFKSSGCGSHFRVNVNSVAMFVAAFKAAKGEVVVKETQAPKAVAPAALVDVNLALALEEVEEEEAKAVSPREAAIASIKAARPDRAEDEAFIAKVLSRMGL